MGNSTSARNESKVVIVGGGYGGVNVAINLDNYCHVILIDPKPFFHHCIASLRAAVTSAGFEKKVMIPYEPAIKNGEFKQGTVIGVNTSEKYVTLQSEEKVEYDYLIFACGSSNDFPGKLPLGSSEENAKQLYDELRAKIKDSKNIVIIGGGPIGIELAGEIVDEYDDKVIHIIHNRDTLCDPSLSAKFHKNLLAAVKRKGINVVLEERANLDEIDFKSGIGWVTGPLKITTNNPETNIDADLLLKCIGMRINSGAYQSSLSDKMDEKRQLKVNEYFQVADLENVFAIGDCCDSKEIKEAFVAGMHADNVSANIRNLLGGKALKKYKPGNSAMLVPLGKNGGVGELPNGMVLGDFATKKIKGQGLLISRQWKSMKQSAPS